MFPPQRRFPKLGAATFLELVYGDVALKTQKSASSVSGVSKNTISVLAQFIKDAILIYERNHPVMVSVPIGRTLFFASL